MSSCEELDFFLSHGYLILGAFALPMKSLSIAELEIVHQEIINMIEKWEKLLNALWTYFAIRY